MAEKTLEYKTKNGKVLYGFSQTHLDKTNNRLNGVIINLQIIVILLIIFLVGIAAFMGWIAYNDIITRLIYGF